MSRETAESATRRLRIALQESVALAVELARAEAEIMNRRRRRR